MKNLTKILLSLIVVFAVGCDSSTRTPTSVFDPDTTGQGGNNGGGGLAQYGTLFFQSNALTSWVTGVNTSVSNGVLLAENESADTVTATIAFADRITFGEKKDLTFVWRGGVTGNAIIFFYVSADGVHWLSLPYYPNNDWQAAPYVLFTADGTPLTFRFDFKMPPGGRVRITEVRAYGR